MHIIPGIPDANKHVKKQKRNSYLVLIIDAIRKQKKSNSS